MNAGAAATGRGRGFRLAEAFGYALVAGSVWLAWEVVKAPLADRTPPATAIRLAPGSPEVLRRAAEAELLAGRADNARVLSMESLSRAPFNARALRVRGLAEARLASADRADEMLTLAGNWSLRDDPAHAWLVRHRLERGDYGSAFAHADTLARRRPESYPSIFRLFTTAAMQDSRSMPFLARLLEARPPWRYAYLNYLYELGTPGAPVLGALAVSLERTEGRFTVEELQQLYLSWAASNRFAGIKEVRRLTGRPGLTRPLQNGDFSTAAEKQFLPFGWTAGAGAGMSTGVTEDDLRLHNLAFRLEYDGFASGVFTEQLLLLDPGDYIFAGERRAETPQADMRMDWQLVCAETGLPSSPVTRAGSSGEAGDWMRFQVRFRVPRENCSAQWLLLVARPGDRRTTIGAWFDNLEIRAASATDRAASPANDTAFGSRKDKPTITR